MSVDANQVREAVGQRFHQPPAPTLFALEKPRRLPIIVSYVSSPAPLLETTLPPPLDAGFAIHVHHRPLQNAETWINGKHGVLPMVPGGGLCFFDLRTSPVARLHEGFEFTRFYLARATLDDLAYENELGHVGELRLPPFGHPDPVIECLALALRARVQAVGNEVDSLFADGVALAFHAHVVGAYGHVTTRPRGGGQLSPRRLRFVSQWMTDRLAEPMSIASIAAQIGMAPGHFARAFREATGEPPHRWLTARRVERARMLLEGDGLSVAEIAEACGFADQSHLTRAFRQRMSTTPASWRRRHRG